MAEVDGRRLQKTVLGTELDAAGCQVLAEGMQAHVLADGEALVTEGASDRCLHLLIEGELVVSHRTQGGDEVEVVTLRSGECAGTAAFIDGSPRLGTLTARGEALVYALEPGPFEALLDSHPRVVYQVMRALFRARHDNLVRLYRETEQLTNYITKTHGRY